MVTYLGGDHGHYPDRATIDHLSTRGNRQRPAGMPRPEQGWTVLSCADCNGTRGRISMLLHSKPVICQECARLGKGQFCGMGCFIVNRTRLGARLLPAEQHKLEQKKARRRAKDREHRRRWRSRIRLRQALADAALSGAASRAGLAWSGTLIPGAPAPVEPGPVIQAPPFP